MGRLRNEVYAPDAARHKAYDELYALYGSLHDHFGRDQRSLMRALQSIRERSAPVGGR
jgi:L-ribulokinase